MPVEAIEHAAAAGDHELVAQLLVEYHLPLIRGGAGRTLLRWVRTLPDDRIVEHPELAVAAATAAVLVGGSTIEQRRLLQLADAARRGRPERADAYVETAARLVRALTIDGGVGQAVLDGRRAVELAEAGADEILTAALAAYARALFFAGELDEASAVALRALEHPDDRAARPEPGGRPLDARARRRRARTARLRASATPRRRRRPWAGSAPAEAGSAPTRPPPSASVLAAEGSLAEAEHELASAERFFRDEVATLHHTWLLVLLARVRLRRGRLGEAEATLRSAREALDELADSGPRAGARRRGGAGARGGERPRAQRGDARAAERGRARRAAAPGHRPVDPRDRRAPLPLPEHDPVAQARAVPQARGPLPGGRDRARHRARPAGANRNHPGDRRAIPRMRARARVRSSEVWLTGTIG